MSAGNRFLQSSARNVGTSYPDAYGSWGAMCISDGVNCHDCALGFYYRESCRSCQWMSQRESWNLAAGKCMKHTSLGYVQEKCDYSCSPFTHTLMHVHTCMHKHMHICTHTCMYMHPCHAHTHSLHTHAYTYAHTHARTLTYTCMYTHTHVHTHTHTHTHTYAVWVLNVVFLKNWC